MKWFIFALLITAFHSTAMAIPTPVGASHCTAMDVLKKGTPNLFALDTRANNGQGQAAGATRAN